MATATLPACHHDDWRTLTPIGIQFGWDPLQEVEALEQANCPACRTTLSRPINVQLLHSNHEVRGHRIAALRRLVLQACEALLDPNWERRERVHDEVLAALESL